MPVCVRVVQWRPVGSGTHECIHTHIPKGGNGARIVSQVHFAAIKVAIQSEPSWCCCYCCCVSDNFQQFKLLSEFIFRLNYSYIWKRFIACHKADAPRLLRLRFVLWLISEEERDNLVWNAFGWLGRQPRVQRWVFQRPARNEYVSKCCENQT